MTLTDLIAGLDGVDLAQGDGAVPVTALTHDSRAVGPGSLYVALPGRRVHGLTFVDGAVAKGAAAVAIPAGEPLPAVPVPVITLDAPRPALAELASRLHGEPSRRLKLLGITGTNGKTTVATLVAEMVAAAGWAPGLIGTNELRIGGDAQPARFTTPEAPVLQGLLADMVAAEVAVAAMEVSSVGLAEHRVHASHFAAVAYTNLSPDHLDYHGDMAAYAAAKARLFTEHPEALAVINVEDEFGQSLAAGRASCWRVALDGRAAEVSVDGLVVDAKGWRGRLVTPAGAVEVECPLLGRFNALNAVTAGALALAAGVPPGAVAEALANASIPGRMEPVSLSGGPQVVVDYAHSPDALVRVIETLRPLTAGRLWVVFGCGGDRDAVKRGPMGAAAAAADAVVLTNDNPRSEAPAEIAAAALAGAQAAGRPATRQPRPGHTWVQLDRRAAIAGAVAAAAPEDTVLVAGKGHEAYQEIAGVRWPFDDVQEARRALAARAGAPRFHTDQLVGSAGGALVGGAPVAFDGVSIDTRTLQAGDAFFALRGPNFDGHRFLDRAVSGGARVLVVEAGHPTLAELATDAAAVVAVPDVQAALQALAAAHRAAFPGLLVGLTGSSGKTTTKEFIAAVLGQVGAVHKTPGNLNNHLGVPLTLLGLRAAHRFAVVEMGMNHAGEIAELAALARPEVGVVTTVGEAHIEHLGSVRAIARAKGELLDALPADALAITPSVVRHEGELVAGLKAPRWTVGAAAGDRVIVRAPRATATGMACDLVVDAQAYPLRLQLSGAHNLSNAALAVAVGLRCGVPVAAAVAALARVPAPSLRGETRTLTDGGLVVLDCYNANPQSTCAAAQTFADAHPTGWLVLGDMLELGERGPTLHTQTGATIAGHAPQARILGVGPLSRHLVEGARAAGASHVWHVADLEAAVRTLRAERPAGAPVLLKASRGMALERVWAQLSQEGA